MKMAKEVVEKITGNMTFREIVENYPDSAEFFFKKGFHCIGCPMASRESIKEGALAHGENPKKFIDELNKFLEKQNEKKISE
jgi:hybrid cluster-associated redox disulfide protein